MIFDSKGYKLEVGSAATGFQVKIDFSAFAAVIRSVPKIALYRYRSFFVQCLIDHRQTWLKTKSNKFGRGSGERGRGIGVSRVQSDRDTAKPNEVLYIVKPEKRRASTGSEAMRLLEQMRADIYTGNGALPVHEFGEDIKTSRYMSIPFQTRGSKAVNKRKVGIAEWKKLYPSKVLRFKRGKSGNLLAFEHTRVMKRGRLRQGEQRRVLGERWRLRFILTKKVEMDPTLRFYQAWADTEKMRDKAWDFTVNAIGRDIQKDDPRDR